MNKPIKAPRRGAAVSAILELLLVAQRARPSELEGLVVAHAARLGIVDLSFWLIDLQQEVLVPFTSMNSVEDHLSMHGTLAGRACREGTIQHVAGDDGIIVWLPLIDAGNRLGALGGRIHKWTPAVADLLEHFAIATASLVTSQQSHSDLVIRARRLEEVSLAAELQWNLLPPLSFCTTGAAICGLLEPAYDVGGDSFDYAVNNGVIHFAIFDAVGHGLNAAIMATIAIGAYRQARRSGKPLDATYEAIDFAIAKQYRQDGFVTGILAELDLNSGELTYVLAGHHPPMVLRHGKVARHLDTAPQLPFGLAVLGPSSGGCERESLEPGDRILLYTDGVIEAHSTSGEQFGVERLEDFLVRENLTATSAPETLRRLVSAVMEHQKGDLQDDASLLLIEWDHTADSSPMTKPHQLGNDGR